MALFGVRIARWCWCGHMVPAAIGDAAGAIEARWDWVARIGLLVNHGMEDECYV